MDNKQIEALVKLRDSLNMAAEALNDYIDTFAPRETKEKVAETVFLDLKYEAMHGLKLGDYQLAFKNGSDPDKFQKAYNILTTAKATIKDRYHAPDYQFSYWLYESDKIYRQQLKELKP